ncbi:MAG TPA: XRE family transcriptional regulator [Verrucomicrobiales bacterium]|nr:XRE family transcriptional regulator [Verrucomicrobiales bacterium]
MATRSLSKSFGGVVRAHRTKQNLTQEQVAERAGIHPTYVGMVERGERNCSLDIAAEIATALEVPLSQLVEEAEVSQRKKAIPVNRKGRQL